MNFKNLFKKREPVTAEEAISFFTELHGLLQKINERCDAMPRLRSVIEANLGVSMERVIGKTEDALYMLDNNKKYINGDMNIRKNLTAQIDKAVESFALVVKDLKSIDDEYERINREGNGI